MGSVVAKRTKKNCIMEVILCHQKLSFLHWPQSMKEYVDIRDFFSNCFDILKCVYLRWEYQLLKWILWSINILFCF
jgi:hypothetical protein